ncbi:MAG: peptidase [Thermosynechococcus sp. Uc]|nr:peptidase [Thermosynechococcus sp. Uc]MDM7326063.1 peptidase [Thermosynechococcus sp. Uc]
MGILTTSGRVMAADLRPNTQVDYIATYQKLFDFSMPRERVIVICTAGQLSITQEVLTPIRSDLKGELEYCLNSLPNMYEAARYVGGKLREVTESHRLSLGGQEPYLYFIYSQDNFLQATPETPFLQVGETKYDKPILARTLRFDTAVDAGLLTLDSTMKSNISVGSPLDLILYRTDNFEMRSITAPNFS